ncbi:MAG TPA: UDP-N-acetylglucosamine 1-carboxyvinyltransferase, partial [Tissierellaceae bacterium]|nr:UDP-N-acetylglucosamine 1-carboxyvinyltransferase [Tissierellaceae bacterium]
MAKYIIQGGNRLEGEVEIKGAKNSILPILAATVISGEVSKISNIPQLRDVEVMTKILLSIGAKVEKEGDQLLIDTSSIDKTQLPEELVREMRSSIILMGALLARFGEVSVSYPGGCEIGPRPIDLHLKSLRQMGAIIEESHGFLHCRSLGLQGADIQLDYPSVGATENIMLAASIAEGRTIIRNAAREPEIIDLQDYLRKAGAKIKGAGTSVITVEGVPSLKGCSHRIIPDRIVAGTLMVAATITKGEMVVKDIVVEHLQSTVAKLRETGANIFINGNAIKLIGPERVEPIELLQTLPYP